MGRYALRRSMQTLPLLVGIAAISYLFMRLAPGGPLALMAHNPRMTQAQLDNIKANLGLDKPVGVQFALWLGGLLRGDWGYSYVDGRPVLQVILERAPATIELMGAGFLIAFALAVPIGLLAAARPYGVFDHVTTVLAFCALSMPVFWVGLLLQLLFAVRLGALPSAGMYDATANTVTPGDALRHLILPACALGLGGVAGWSRYTRGALLDVMGQDFIRTARAKGLTGARVTLTHAMRNALIPLVTVIALDFPAYAVGAALISTVIGVTVGAVAGWRGGWVDNALMRVVDLALSVPALFLLLVLFSITGGASAAVIVVYLGLFGWMYMARIVRARILTLKGLDFVQGARAIGASPARIVLRHLLPNALGAIIVTTTLQIAYNMLAEAALDFLGYGVAAGTPTWGVMLNAAEQRLLDAPGLIIAPGLALTGAILCVNLVGDGLRDALDPRQP